MNTEHTNDQLPPINVDCDLSRFYFHGTGDGYQREESSNKDTDGMDILDPDYGDRKEGQEVLSKIEEKCGPSGVKLDQESKSGFELGDGEGCECDSEVEDLVREKNKVGVTKEKGREDEEREGLSEAQDELADAVEVPELVSDHSVEMNVGDKRKRKENRPILMWEVWEEENKRWLESHEEADTDIDNENEFLAETAEPPPSLIMPLLRYQKEWLAWALKQEESAARGGILADEMGMGKTLQAIALVLAKQEFNRAVDGALSPPSSSTGLPNVKATLVISPLGAVIQWANEISRCTQRGSNKVLVYHGSNRGKTLHELSDYDFVITTYSIAEAEYRKYVLPPKEKCMWCGKLFYEENMFFHQLFVCCPENAIRTNKQLNQRKSKNAGVDVTDELVDDGKINWCFDKDKAIAAGSSTNDSKGAEKGPIKRKCNLHSVNWNRIILDEAHYIKDRRSSTIKAVLTLNSSYKWALSGIPLQNRVGELRSLIRFLQINPYSCYFCYDCDCTALDYNSSTSKCSNCNHLSVRHFCWWNKHITTPIKLDGHSGSGKEAMILLKHRILKSLLIRRTKKGRSADLALPPKMILLRRDSLDIKEKDFYSSLYNESQAQFNTYVSEGAVTNNFTTVFDLLTCARQALNHPYLVVYSKAAMSKNSSVVDANGEVICGLCHESVEDPVVNACGHTFCRSCLIDFSASAGQVSCPTCKKQVTADFSTKKDQVHEDTKTTITGFKSSSILNRIRLDDFQTSTKLEALREEIRYMLERDGSAKGIVFSQFPAFLDLIHYSLQKSGIQCAQLDGSMTMKARDASITRFNKDPDCRIFLMTLKTGGIALNLTVASHVFLMEPWWNPAVELQAQDRIHRIGQFKPTRVVRFIIEDTIEERILKLQEKKELIFEATIGGSAEALGKLTEQDMKFLFLT